MSFVHICHHSYIKLVRIQVRMYIPLVLQSPLHTGTHWRAAGRFDLIDLVDRRPGSAIIARRSTAWHASWHTSRHTTLATGSTVHLHHDRVANTFELLLLGLILVLLGGLVGIQPLGGLGHGLLDRLLVGGIDLVLHLLVVDRVAHRVRVVLELVLCLDFLFHGVILGGVLLRFLHHALNVVLRQATLVVGNGDVVLSGGGLVLGRYIHDAVGVEVKGHLDLRDTARCRGDAVQVELAQLVVVLSHLALSLEDLDQHTRLVVLVSRESLILLGRDGGVAGDQGGHHATNGLQAERQRGHIEQQQILGLLTAGAGQDSGLDGRTVSDSFVRVDLARRLLAVEEVGQHGLNLGNAGGTANKHDIVHAVLRDLGVGSTFSTGSMDLRKRSMQSSS